MFNIQILTTEVYKIVNNICPPIMKVFFSLVKNKYNFKNSQEIEQQQKRIVRYGLEKALCRTPQLCSLVPSDIELLSNVYLFRSKIKQWNCTDAHVILT